MKANIVTFHSAYNYGAVLQAYALQEYLNENFADTKILDYHNESIDKSYRTPSFRDFLHNPKNAVFRSMQAILFRGKNKRIDLFRDEFLYLTKRYDKSNVDCAIDEAEVFITGSDQVWNYLIVHKDSTYYLEFAKEKCTCSYAASFGVAEIPDEFEEFYKKQLGNIDYLSVREERGRELASALYDKNVSVMPDPTMLISKEQWEKLCIEPDVKGRYILVYKITKADKLLNFAKNISQKTGLQIIYIPNDLKAGTIGTLKLNVGPREWLGYIKNAEYIVTNSFHGTVFSILFGRKFFVEVSKKVNPSTSRVQSLLKMFGLENRTFDRYTETSISDELSTVDIFGILKKQTEKADMFFDEVFNGEKMNDIL